MSTFLHVARRVAGVAVLAGIAQGCGAKVEVATTTGGGGGTDGGSGGALPTSGAGAGGGASSDVASSGTGAAGGAGGAGGGEPVACASDSRGRPLAIQSGGAGYTLAAPERIEVPQDFYSALLIGDVTGDGRADVMGAEIDHATFFQQKTSGSLGAPKEIPHDWDNPGSAMLLHASPDAILDFAVISEDGLEIIRSLGGGEFAAPILLPGLYGYGAEVVDLDFDGHDDLIWVAYGDVTFAYGDGAGSFSEPVSLVTSPQKVFGLLARRDMTGDMIPDFVSYDYPALTSLIVIPHDGVGGPSPEGWTKVPLPGNKKLEGLDVGDVNGDGLTDIAWQEEGNSDYDVRTYLMLAEPGGFGAPVEIAQNGWSGPVLIADVNADGRNDVVIEHEGAFSVTVVLATAAGMGPPKDYDFPTAASTGPISVGDVDCDGCPDIVAADVGGLVVFRGQGCGQ